MLKGNVPFIAFFLIVVSLSWPSHIHHSPDAFDLVLALSLLEEASPIYTRSEKGKDLDIACLEETGIHAHNKIEHTFKPGVSSFSVIANEVKLYLVTLSGGLVLLHSNEAFDAGSLTSSY